MKLLWHASVCAWTSAVATVSENVCANECVDLRMQAAFISAYVSGDTTVNLFAGVSLNVIVDETASFYVDVHIYATNILMYSHV